MSATATAIAAPPAEEERKAPPPKRDTRGKLGTGTRSDRVKAAWRAFKKETGKDVPLRTWAKKALPSLARIEVEEGEHDLAADLAGWLEVKSHVHTPTVRKAMKEAKSKKRAKPKKPSKDRRRVKGNSGKR